MLEFLSRRYDSPLSRPSGADYIKVRGEQVRNNVSSRWTGMPLNFAAVMALTVDGRSEDPCRNLHGTFARGRWRKGNIEGKSVNGSDSIFSDPQLAGLSRMTGDL